MTPEITFTIILCHCYLMVTGAPAESEKAEQCKKAVNSHFKEVHKFFMDCHVETKLGSTSDEELFGKLGCSIKCLFKKSKLFDENDMTSDEILKLSIPDRVSPDYAPALEAKYLECNEKFGKKLDPSDPLCESYKPFGLCIQETTSNICYE